MDDLELDAYVRRNYKMTAPGDPLIPFWDGDATYAVTSPVPVGQYAWQVQGDGSIYIPDTAPESDPTTSTPNKHLHHDFGPTNDGFPKITTTKVLVSPSNAEMPILGPAKAKVTWHLPVKVVAMSPPPGSYPADPDDDEADLMEQAAAISRTQAKTVDVGRKLVGTVYNLLYGELPKQAIFISATNGINIVAEGAEAVAAVDAATQAVETGVPAADGANAAEDAVGIANAGADFVRIHPDDVRFAQDSIKYTFKNGQTIDEVAQGLRDGTILAKDIPPIRLVLKDGVLYTLDNRRLETFRRAGEYIPFRMATPEEAATEAWKFTTENGGTSIVVIGQP